MNWMKYRLLYFLISGAVIGLGIFSLVKWGLKIGIDFTGGVVAEYKLSNGEDKVFRYGQLTDPELQRMRLDLKNQGAQELRFDKVGPSVGPELVKKTVYGLVISAGGILLWVAFQFKSFKFGISAVLAMLHDSLVVIGMYSLFGHFAGAEVDLLFVTAVLTILSFSVHDTIIVYDRIRESQKGFPGSTRELANKAITETMVRSLNNSFVVIFMMVALLLLGGTSIRWFVATLLIGTISGAYSSPFVAVPILVTWDEIEKKVKG